MGALGAVLGLSWGPLGALLGNLGAILRPRKAIGSEQARRQKSFMFFRFLKDLGILGASLGSSLASLSRLGAVLGRSWGLLEHLGSHLEASWAILSHLGGHLGLSEALSEPSWANKYPLTPRGPARPGPGEGTWEGQTPL